MNTVLSIFGIKPFRIGGQEVFAHELSAQLAERGWKSVLCFDSQPVGGVRDYLQLPNVSFETLASPEQARRHTLMRFWRMVREHRPRVLHLHYTGFLSPYPWLAKLLGTETIFFTDHSSRHISWEPRRAPAWKRTAARAINFPLTKAVCVSDYGRKCMLALDLLPEDRFRTIYNGVDLRRVPQDPALATAFRRKYLIPEDRALVVQVSWMIPEKGVADLLRAARLVLARNPHLHFAMVGEGAHRQEYAELARTLGIHDHVTWTGTVEDPFGEGVYAAADVCCQLSRWGEVFGFAIAEAMAWGKPVLATRVGGIPELIQDGDNGFLVSPNNPEQVAEKLLVLLADRQLRTKMGQSGWQIAKSKFEVRANVTQLLTLYGIPQRG